MNESPKLIDRYATFISNFNAAYQISDLKFPMPALWPDDPLLILKRQAVCTPVQSPTAPSILPSSPIDPVASPATTTPFTKHVQPPISIVTPARITTPVAAAVAAAETQSGPTIIESTTPIATPAVITAPAAPAAAITQHAPTTTTSPASSPSPVLWANYPCTDDTQCLNLVCEPSGDIGTCNTSYK